MLALECVTRAARKASVAQLPQRANVDRIVP